MLLRPVKVAVQELERPLAVDRRRVAGLVDEDVERGVPAGGSDGDLVALAAGELDPVVALGGVEAVARAAVDLLAELVGRAGGVAHGFPPHAWGLYAPTVIEYGIMLGAFCLFFFLFVLFVKHLPSVSMTEMKETLGEGAGHGA